MSVVLKKKQSVVFNRACLYIYIYRERGGAGKETLGMINEITKEKEKERADR